MPPIFPLAWFGRGSAKIHRLLAIERGVGDTDDAAAPANGSLIALIKRARDLLTSRVDAANTTSAPLGAGATFLGPFVNVAEFAEVAVSVFADVAGTLTVEWSIDGAAVIDTDVFPVAAADGDTITFKAVPSFVRVRYVNGGAAQTTFALETQLKRFPARPSTHRLDGDVKNTDDATLSIAAIVGKDLAGVPRQARVTETGGLLTSSDALATPPNTTQVVRTAYDAVAVSSDTFYTITSGKTLTIQRMTTAIEASTAGSVVELFYDPNGDLSVLTPIVAIIGSGTSNQADINDDFVGNGTRRIVMRRRRFDGGSRTIFARWKGYEK